MGPPSIRAAIPDKSRDWECCPSRTSRIPPLPPFSCEKKTNQSCDSYRHVTTINVIPNDVLLQIFDFCQWNHDAFLPVPVPVMKWHSLVRVCRRWRQIIFASPLRLNLQILCTYGTPVRKKLGIWPAFPIVIDLYSMNGIPPNDEDDVVAAFNSKHFGRIRSVRLDVTGPQLERIAPTMQEPFPALTCLHLRTSEVGNVPELPAKFLGGSAPSLQEVSLYGIPYPTLPTLLGSASSLVELDLRNIPRNGHISPESLAVGLVALPRLEIFILGFQSHPHPSPILPPPVTPSPIIPPPVTPAVQALLSLTYFEFKGASEYLEDLVSRLQGPALEHILITYLNQLIDYKVPYLSKFIHRSVAPEIILCKYAKVTFSGHEASFAIYPHANHPSDWGHARTIIECEGIDWQVYHMAQVLRQIFARKPLKASQPTLFNVVHLKLEVEPESHRINDADDDIDWPTLLHQFPTARTLHVSQELAGHIALVLDSVPESMAAEVLPSLNLICLAGQPASSVEKFASARRFSDQPVTVVNTERVFDERLEAFVSE